MIDDPLAALYLHPEAESASVRDPVRNRQLHDPVRQAGATQALKESGLDLHNGKSPNLDIIHEQPEHRVMLYLRCQGRTMKEIAEATGYSYNWVTQVVKQPWFRLRLVELLQSEGKNALETILKAEAIPSVEVLIDIRDNPKARDADRVACSRELLDRFLGKSVAKVETKTTLTVGDAATEAAANARELEKINSEMAARGIAGFGTSN